VRRDQLPRDREPEPEASLLSIETLRALRERFEDARQEIRRDARAVVDDLELDDIAVGARGNADVPSGRRVLRRVVEQVDDHLREPPAVGVDDEAGRRHGHGERVLALLDERARRFDGVGDDGRELDRSALEVQTAAHRARHVEQIVDEAHEVIHLPLDDRSLLFEHAGAAPVHELERSDDRRERIAQLVAAGRAKDQFLAMLSGTPSLALSLARMSWHELGPER
jgi:hypothetical protein